jgi:hypothetical protein
MLDSLLGNIAGADIAAFNHTSLVSTISAGPEDITHEQYMHHINIDAMNYLCINNYLFTFIKLCFTSSCYAMMLECNVLHFLKQMISS